MFSSVDKTLADGESLEETVNPSRMDTRYFKNFLFAGFMTILVLVLTIQTATSNILPVHPSYAMALLVAPLIMAGLTELRRRFTMYHLTDKKIIEEKGILNKNWVSINYDDITHVKMNQDIEERVFGVSDIKIDTAGESTTELDMEGLKNPHTYKKKIMKHSQ